MSLNKLQLLVKNVIGARLDIEFGKTIATEKTLAVPELEASELTRFIQENELTNNEVVTLIMALLPHISPEYLSSIISDYLPNGGEFPEFGGVKGKNHRGILPTGETVLYVLAGRDPELRNKLLPLFAEDHLFARKEILYLEEVPAGEPRMSGKLIMDQEYVELFTTGKISKPKLSCDFPAQYIETDLVWDDLILNKKTSSQIAEIETWLNHNEVLLNDWGMKSRIKPGFRVLFTGLPGTGKTLTATLLGKYTHRDVFRIDLSLVVSKYIGETEKNLSKLFDRARHKNWILFFDEADAIFGKRTSIRDAHDKYANQEVSYLLQRIESHEGLVILASNMKNNIDSAFTRRFNAIIEFENPTAEERLKLWNSNIPDQVQLEDKIVLEDLARKYEVNGANIVNIIHYACLKTIENRSTRIKYLDLLNGIQKEYIKEGKFINFR
ncbi:MAG: ATP-binding protein [Prolixibacteraceae bacterium]